MKTLEDIDQMRERHKQEIELLQKNCEHKKISSWIEECWAPAHFSGSKVKVCLFCNKVIKRTKVNTVSIRIPE